MTLSFQKRVWHWMLQIFPYEEMYGQVRCDRFLEEVFEMLQAMNYPKDRIDRLRDYVYDRPIGEPRQEVGGVMVTLAALCEAHNIDMDIAGECELDRCWDNSEQIRQKQAMKRDKLGPLP